MAVDVSKIPNNSKFDPVREAILKLQKDVRDGVSGVATVNSSDGNITITNSGNITVGTVGETITIGIDDSTYLTEEVNDLTSAVTWANVPDANITQSSVTQHQAALSITESQISDLGNYLDLDNTGTQTVAGNIVIEGDLTTSGSITYINSTHLDIGDNIIKLNADITSTTAPTEDAGFYVNRGSSPDVSFLWDEQDDRFSTYASALATASLYIGSNQVINSSRQFLGSSTISSTVPYFTFSGDSNTGVGRATNNKVSLIAEGTKVLEASDTGVDITGTLDVSGSLTADGIVLTDEIITSADFSATNNRFKLTLTQADTGTIEASFDDVVLSESMAADYIPYVKVGGGDGDTTNAILNDSFLKINGSTLELDWDTGNPLTVAEHDLKMRKDGGGSGTYYQATYAADSVSFLHYASASDIDTAKVGATSTGRVRINDTYSLPAGDGTSGQVLSTNGSGDLSWVAAGGPTTSDLQDVTDNGSTTTNAITTGDITIAKGTTYKQSHHALYIGGDGLASVDSAIYIGNRSNGTGYGWELYYVGTGSGNNNRFQIKAENLGSPITALDIYQDGTFIIPTGNVGIGQTSPQAPLDVYTSADFVGRFASSDNKAFLVVKDNDTTTYWSAENAKMSLGFNAGVNAGNLNIDGSGNVGIGTTSPNYKLSVYTNGDVYSADFYQGNSGTDKYNAIRVRGAMTSAVGYYGIGGSTTGNTSFRDAFVVGTQSAHSLNLATSDTARMTITSGGNVGIGTTSPSHKLHVVGDTYLNGKVGIGITPTTTWDLRIKGQYPLQLSDSSSSAKFEFYADLGENRYLNGSKIVGYNQDLSIDTTSSSYDILLANNGGNVGIGTTSPAAVDTNNGTPRLQVEVPSSAGNHPLAARFTVSSDAGDNSGVSVLINSGNDRGLMISAGRAVGNVARSTLNIITNTGDELTDGITLRQHNSGGTTSNIGIGTTTPTDKLQIDAPNSQLRLRDTDDGTFTQFSSSGNLLAIRQNSTTASDHFWMNSSGRVGLGTNSPSNKLHVKSGDNEGIFMEGTGGGHWFNFKSGTSNLWSMGAQTGLMGWYNRTTSSYKMVITDVGNVGIGTTSPSYKLDVTGSARFGNYITFTTGTSIPAAAISYHINGYLYIKGGGSGVAIGDDSFATSIYCIDNGNIEFSTAGNGTKMVLNSSGNLGIGTTSPSETLQVQGNIRIAPTGSALLFDTTGGNSSNGIKTINDYETVIYNGRGAAGFAVIGNSSIRIGFGTSYTAAQSSIYIPSSGNVGIGTTSPSAKLEVKSSHSTTEPTMLIGSFNSSNSQPYGMLGTYDPYHGLVMRGYPNNASTYGVTPADIMSFYEYGGKFRFYKKQAGVLSIVAEIDDTTTYFDSNVGIGTTSPSYPLDVKGVAEVARFTGSQTGYTQGSIILSSGTDNSPQARGQGVYMFNEGTDKTWYMGTRYQDADDFIISRLTGTTSLGVSAATIGNALINVTAGGNLRVKADVIAYYSFSDKRLKTNIKPLENSLDKIKALQGVSYQWKDGERKGKTEVGLIAQEVEKVIPEVVREQKRLGDDTNYKTVDYEKLTGVLIEAIKEQQKQIDELKARLDGGTK